MKHIWVRTRNEAIFSYECTACGSPLTKSNEFEDCTFQGKMSTSPKTKLLILLKRAIEDGGDILQPMAALIDDKHLTLGALDRFVRSCEGQ